MAHPEILGPIKYDDGMTTRVALEDVPGREPVDVSAWGGYSGILDEADLTAVAAAISPGSLAAALVYENVWAHHARDPGQWCPTAGWPRVDSDDLAGALGLRGTPTTTTR